MICRRCETDLPESEFYRYADGAIKGRVCKPCHRATNRAWRASNIERQKQMARRWREANPERWRALTRRHKATPEAKLKEKVARYCRNYGLTPGEVVALLASRPDRCPICQRERRLELDHCHGTGKPRGWLCHSCNWGLGAFSDDPEALDRAAGYLRESRELKVAT